MKHFALFLFAILIVASFSGCNFDEKTWYQARYNTSSDKVSISKRPIDCDWGKAPLGDKGCHYEKKVEVSGYNEQGLTGTCSTGDPHELYRYGLYKCTPGQRVISWDGGQTWELYNGTATNPTRHSKVVSVYWEKVEDY